jgi:hypothetical protein
MRSLNINPIVSIFIFMSLLFLLFGVASLVLFLSLPAVRSLERVYVPPFGTTPCLGKAGCGNKAGGEDFSLSNQSLGGIQVEYEWTDQMDITSSDSITLSIGRQGVVLPDKALTPHASNRKLSVGDLSTDDTALGGVGPVGPVTALKDAFGSKYDVFAVAHLAATAFDMKTFDSPEQSLHQQALHWNWIIKPNTIGSQVVLMSMDFLWKPIGGGQVIDRQVWEKQLSVDVTQLWYDRGQISLFGALSAALTPTSLVGAIIVAMITSRLGRLKEKKEQNIIKEKEKDKEKK